MAAGVVSVGRYRYAVGLYWENSPGSGRVAQIAKEAANQPGQQADFYAVRRGNKNGRIPQFGLTTAEAGQKAGMPALAPCLAAQIPGSWAGAFRLNEGVAVVVVRDDLIVPDGDLFFMDETEARDRLIQEVGFGGLQNVYAPESWSIPSADTIPVSLLLNERHDVKLQLVQIPQTIKLAAAGLALVFIVVLGGIWWWQARLDAERAEQEALAARLHQMKIPSLQHQPPPEPVYDRKWQKAPPQLAVIDACYDALKQITAAVAGWRMGGAKCSGASITVNWSREKGMSEPPPQASVNDTATSAVQTMALPPLSPRGDEALADPDDITRRYLSQNWPGTINRAADDPLPPPPAGYKGPWNPPPPPWVKRSFTLTVPELPASLPQLIGDLPGVIINSMNYSANGTSGNWVVEGVIYENRK